MHLRLSQISTVVWTPQRSHFLLLRSCSHCSSFLEQGTLWKPTSHVFPWSLSSQFQSGAFTFPKGGRHFMSKWNIITKALRALEHFSSSLLTQSWSLWLSGPVPTHQATALGLVCQPSSRWLMPQPNKLLIYVREHPQESKEQTDLGCRTHKKKSLSDWAFPLPAKCKGLLYQERRKSLLVYSSDTWQALKRGCCEMDPFFLWIFLKICGFLKLSHKVLEGISMWVNFHFLPWEILVLHKYKIAFLEFGLLLGKPTQSHLHRVCEHQSPVQVWDL